MKKIYQAPALEIELYQLDASIAGNCTSFVSLGPDLDGYEACQEFKSYNLWSDSKIVWFNSKSSGALGGAGSFYENSACSCYYTADGQGYFTS